MLLSKAIEILQDIKEGIDTADLPDDTTAVQLGLEALQWIIDSRPPPPSLAFSLLPGETASADSPPD